MIMNINQFLKSKVIAKSDNKSSHLKHKRLYYFALVIIFLSLLIGGCNTTIIEPVIKETLTINSGDVQINRNEYSSLAFTSDLKSSSKTSNVECISSNEIIAVVVNKKVFGLSSGVANISCSIGDIISNSIIATIIDNNKAAEENGGTPKKPSDPINLTTPSAPAIATTPSTPNPSVAPTTPASPTTPSIPTTTSGKLLVVSYIDVGQGDSVLVQTPNGKNILIDAGTSSFETKISDYLKTKDITKIDVLIATHPHADHIGGMSYIIENFQIGSVYMPRATTTTKTYETLLTTIKNKGLTINAAKAGVSINLNNDISISIIGPVSSGYNDLNQYSVTIKVIYNIKSFLFMGDAGETSEQEIINSGINIEANVLKVGHHGSSTSTSKLFLEAVSPQYAVICVGAGNTYGHPTEQTLDRLTSAGIKILRTDINGTIVISSDGQSIFTK